LDKGLRLFLLVNLVWKYREESDRTWTVYSLSLWGWRSLRRKRRLL